MRGRSRKEPALRKGIKNALKSIGSVPIRPIKEIAGIVDKTKIKESDKALRLINVQIQARKIELSGIEGDKDLDYSLKLSNEIEFLGKMKKSIEDVQEFIGVYGSN